MSWSSYIYNFFKRLLGYGEQEETPKSENPKPEDDTRKTAIVEDIGVLKSNSEAETTRSGNEIENRQQLKQSEETISCDDNAKRQANDKENELHFPEQEESASSQVEIDFNVNPNFVRSIRTKAAKKDSKPIFGMAVLNKELFVISQHSPDVEVYDAQSLDFLRQFQIKDLFDPIDIRSCKRNKCLYIFDWGVECSEIVRIDLEGRLIHRWSTGQDGGFLSVMDDGNVLLSVWDKNALHEYSPTGKLKFNGEIKLDSSITQLRLGSKLTDNLFLVSHGEDDNSEHRVCIVDNAGTVCKSIGGGECSPESQFDGPNYFAVDRSGAVLVADQNNKRVVILTSDLKFQKELITETDGLRHPVRLELDQTAGRLFVADNDYPLTEDVWRDGRIMVFDFVLRN